MFNLTVLYNRDTARLLRYDDNHSVGQFAQTDSGAVACAKVLRYIALRYGQDTLGRYDTSAINNHRTIVQRRILEEDVAYERYRYVGIDHNSALDDELQVVFLHYDNQRTRTAFAHIEAGRNDWRGVDVLPHL